LEPIGSNTLINLSQDDGSRDTMGKSFAIGLVNVTDRPYKEFLTSIMKCNYSIYDLMMGNKQPILTTLVLAGQDEILKTQ